jgi:hypothetical protein
LSEAIRKIYIPSDKWSVRNYPIFAPACNDQGLALPMLAKATWGIRLPHLQKVGQWASPKEKEKINSEEP